VEINTIKFGKINIGKDRIITFPEDIIGFPQIKRYVFLELDENSPFTWLQAVDEPSLCFLVIDPALFKPDYQVPISKENMYSLQAEEIEELITRVIVTVPENPHFMTANIKGPIVINLMSRLAKQLVLADEMFSAKYRIFQSDEKEFIKPDDQTAKK